jgi:hypothetical protein
MQSNSRIVNPMGDVDKIVDYEIINLTPTAHPKNKLNNYHEQI